MGVDFSPVAVDQAARRAALFGLADRARFAVGDLTRTGLPHASADAAVSIDAFHFAADPAAAAGEARRILRPGRRLVLTNWQPKDPNDPRLPGRMRISWPQLLRSAGFADIEMAARPEWPWTSAIPAATRCSPICKTKPGSVSPWQISCTGWPSPRPFPTGEVPASDAADTRPVVS
jgi:SAM-dependent methyltransferase